MAEVQKAEAPKPTIAQPLKDHDPHGTVEQLRAAGMNTKKYGSCHPKHDYRNIPDEERVRGCPAWKECTLLKIKGKAGPVNLPYRLYKKGGKIREGWGPCFTVMAMASQYNKGDENYVMEILPLGTKVGVRGTRINGVNTDNTPKWEEFIDEQAPPPFPRIGDAAHLLHEQQAQKVREELANRRRQHFMEATVGLGPEDVAKAEAQ